MTKHDRRFKRTQRAIYEAFYKLLLEKDMVDITIHEISNLADIHRSTFYLHFEDKYALLDAYLFSLLPLTHELNEEQPISQQEFLVTSLGHLYDVLEKNRPLFKQLFNERNYPFTIQSTRKALKEFLKKHEHFFPEQLGNSLEFTIHIRIAGLIAMMEWFLAQKSYSREQFITETYDLVHVLERRR